MYYFRYRVQRDEELCGIPGKYSYSMMRGTEYTEQVIHVLTILLCFCQYQTVHSVTGEYCVKSLGVLHLEGSWLNCLVVLQLSKVVILIVWQMKIVNCN